MLTADNSARAHERPAFDTPNILWFFGAFTAAAACDAVISQVHPGARGVWILLVSLAFLAAFARYCCFGCSKGRCIPVFLSTFANG